MDRTLEVLEGNVDLLINRLSTLHSERDAMDARLGELDRRVAELEARLVSAQERVTFLEARIGGEQERRRKASSAVQGLIDRLSSPVEETVQEHRAPASPVAVPRPEIRPASRELADPFEEAVAGLKTISRDREHVTAISASARGRIF